MKWLRIEPSKLLAKGEIVRQRFCAGFAALLIGTALVSLSGVQVARVSVAAIGGVVKDAAGQGLAAVQVDLITSGTVLRSANTDDSGRFSFEGVGVGTYTVRPQKVGYALWLGFPISSDRMGRILRIRTANEKAAIELRMVKSGLLTGRVIDPQGSPEAGIRIRIKRRVYIENGEIGWVSLDRTILTNDRGEYRVFDLPPGEYYVVAQGDPASFATSTLHLTTYYPGTADPISAERIDLKPDQEVRLTDIVRAVVQGAGLRIHLPAVDLSSPRGRELYLEEAFSDVISRPGEDPSVIFLKGVPPGRFRAAVSWPTARGRAYGSIDTLVGANTILDVEMSPHFLHEVNFEITKVQDAALQVTDVKSLILTPDILFSGLEATRVQVTANAKVRLKPGKYQASLQGSPAGVHILQILSKDGTLLPGPIEVAENSTFQVVLGEGGSIVSGIVRDKLGQPVADAVIALVPDAPLDSVDHLYRKTVSDVTGAFELADIVPGSYRIFAWQELQGAAYKNVDFLREYETQARSISITQQNVKVDVSLSDAVSK